MGMISLLVSNMGCSRAHTVIVLVALGTLALQTRDQRRAAPLQKPLESVASSEELDTHKDDAVVIEERSHELPTVGYSG